jgi:hypothetical protein
MANSGLRCYGFRAMNGSMSLESAAFERAIGPVLDILLPEKAEEVLDLHADPDLQRRIEELASKCTEGELSAEERAEYEGYVRANKFTAILMRQAQRFSERTSH